ncbi:MAG: heme exporter protein CcmB [Steroidobacteraceae bacterium]|nr:heme exporter protein CcmB [Steroidobacteraceae bacterium]MDW8259635.1 heme exporter protein CcmB [Gammaproteobacteria bacterium]
MPGFRLILERDLRLAVRRPGQAALPLAFFALVTLLFPLALSPKFGELRAVASGVLWIAALLAALLALDHLLRDDAADGTLEQMVLGSDTLVAVLFAKTCAHWLLTGLPLSLLAPLLALALGVTPAAMPVIVVGLVLGTWSLSLLGTTTAALTLGARRGGVLLTLLTLPLAVPVLIFGARSTKLAIEGLPSAAALYLLAAFTVLAFTLAPLAAAAVVRIAVE